MSKTITAAALHADIFHPRHHRDPRSAEYKAGCLAALRYRLGEAGHIDCPHDLGTAAADAWFAGVSEGLFRSREYQAQESAA